MPDQPTNTDAEVNNDDDAFKGLTVDEVVDPILKALNLDIPAPKKTQPKPAEDPSALSNPPELPKTPEPPKPAEAPKPSKSVPAQVEPKKPEEQPKPAETPQDEPIVDSPAGKAEDNLAATTRVIASETARAVRDALKPVKQPEEKPKAQPGEQLSQTEKIYLDVFAEMEKSGAANSGLVQQFNDYRARLRDYQQKWRDEHPKEKFDINASEHSEFVEANWPNYNEDEFDVIRTDLIARKTVDRELERREKKRREEEARIAVDEESKQINRIVVSQMAKSISPDLEKAEGDLSKIEEQDPLAATIVEAETIKMTPVISELVKLSNPNLGTKFDPSNQHHRSIQRTIAEMEQEIMGLPPAKRVVNGKVFVPLSEWGKMTPEEMAGAWTTDMNSIIDKMTFDAKRRVGERISKIRKPAEPVKKDEPKAAAPNNAAATPSAKPAKPSDNKDDKATPSTASSSDVIPSSVSEFQKISGIGDLVESALF